MLVTPCCFSDSDNINNDCVPSIPPLHSRVPASSAGRCCSWLIQPPQPQPSPRHTTPHHTTPHNITLVSPASSLATSSSWLTTSGQEERFKKRANLTRYLFQPQCSLFSLPNRQGENNNLPPSSGLHLCLHLLVGLHHLQHHYKEWSG